MYITEEEKELLIDDVSEKIKNLMYIKARFKSKKIIENMLDMITPENGDDTFSIIFEMELLINDLLIVLGKHRRREENES